MRPFLIVLCLIALFATGWHAVFKGSGTAHMSGAPQIEDRVAEDVFAAVVPVSTGSVVIDVDGRNVTLSGNAAGQAEHERILAAVRGVALVGSVTSEMKILEEISPFVLVVEKAESGALALSGYVPSEAAESAILTTARAMAQGGSVSTRLALASGAPDGDWAGMVGAGIKALGALVTGTLRITDADGRLAGVAADAAGRDAAASALAAAPMGRWSFDVVGRPPPGGFLFAAKKGADGVITLEGHAPDEAARQMIVAVANDVSARPVAGGLEIATGMPDSAWPERVMSVIRALGPVATGSATVTGSRVVLDVEVASSRDERTLRGLVRKEWLVEVLLLNPTPPANVTIEYKGPDTLTATGLLPEGMTPGELAAALPGIDVSQLAAEERGLPADWKPPFEGLSIVLPRFTSATVTLVDRKFSLKGELERGYSAEGVEASMRTVMDRDWELVFELTERPPLAEVALIKQGQMIALKGVLPLGVTPQIAQKMLRRAVRIDEATTGGDGEPEAWQHNLEVAGEALSLFLDVDGRITEGEIGFDGTLRPGYSQDLVQLWLSSRVTEGWSATVVAQETEAEDGDRRINLRTGQKETFRGGHWLPDMDFPVSGERCATEEKRARRGRKITFVPGSAYFDDEGRALMDRLAAVAAHCLNESEILLDIRAYSDSVGNDRSNMRRTVARANAVRDALIERGAAAAKIRAIGRGEEDPIASNDTLSGRRANRRIELRWYREGDPEPAPPPPPAPAGSADAQAGENTEAGTNTEAGANTNAGTNTNASGGENDSARESSD